MLKNAEACQDLCIGADHNAVRMELAYEAADDMQKGKAEKEVRELACGVGRLQTVRNIRMRSTPQSSSPSSTWARILKI